MKKLLTLLFAFAVTFSLAMPVFAKKGGSEETNATMTKNQKTKKIKKHKKTNKTEQSTKQTK
jgi:hypothetical protein